MKPIILLLFIGLFLSTNLQSQNILVINDNDNITTNTDTLLSALNNTIYNAYDIWSIPDSGGVVPTVSIMNNYDAIIWYCSTDGIDLALWGGTTSGHPNLVAYIQTGKPVWLIGLDILYDHYPTYSVFGAGEFAFDYMGIEAYNYQSYVDDGNLGVPLLEKMSASPTYFLNSIEWIFSTLWYVDGCNASAGTFELYKMGPASYPLQGEVCMFHKKTSSQSVMSTFFDPALINTSSNRSSFLENGITYLLNSNVGITESNILETNISPNPAFNQVSIQTSESKIQEISIFNLSGNKIRSIKVNNISNFLFPLNEIIKGIYLLQVQLDNGKSSNHTLLIN